MKRYKTLLQAVNEVSAILDGSVCVRVCLFEHESDANFDQAYSYNAQRHRWTLERWRISRGAYGL